MGDGEDREWWALSGVMQLDDRKSWALSGAVK
jgi:hypothetical protein